MILLILLCFEGLLFLIFTSVMFGTQVHSICTDETVSGGSLLPLPPRLGWGRGLPAGQTWEPSGQAPSLHLQWPAVFFLPAWDWH